MAVTPGKITHSPEPSHTWMMDFVHLTPDNGKKYLLAMIDPYAKWVEAHPKSCISAEVVAKFLCTHIIPTWEIPRALYSDNGPEFRNEVMERMSKTSGIDLKNHCAYHPQSAGLIERTNGTLKTKLVKTMQSTNRGWTDALPLVLLNMRIIASKGALSPYERIFGRTYSLPHWGDRETYQNQTLADHMRRMLENNEKQISPPVSVCSSSVDEGPRLRPGDWVYVKDTRRPSWKAPRWTGPFQVLLETSYAIKVAEKGSWIHRTHCKIAHK